MSYASPKTICSQELTIDERYKIAQQSDLSKKEMAIATTFLLSEAFTPVLKKAHDELIARTAEDIRDMYYHNGSELLRYRINLDTRTWMTERYGFAGRYEEFITAKGPRIFEFPFNEYNQDVMVRLFKAIEYVNWYFQYEIDLKKEPGIAESANIRNDLTFGKTSPERSFDDSLQSVGLAVAALTAEPVGDVTAEQLFHGVMEQHGKMPSLIVQLSLMLKAEVLGQSGRFVYFKGAVTQNGDGALGLSRKYRDFLKNEGQGCPVAHCMAGEEKSGLQLLLEAVLHVYDSLD